MSLDGAELYGEPECRVCGMPVKRYDKICDHCYINEYEKEVKKAVRYGKKSL